MVYLDSKGEGFSHNYRHTQRARILGLMDILKTNIIMDFCEIEGQDEPGSPNEVK